MLPLAHAGHYAVWVLYALPVVFVVAGIAKTALSEHRRGNDRDRSIEESRLNRTPD